MSSSNTHPRNQENPLDFGSRIIVAAILISAMITLLALAVLLIVHIVQHDLLQKNIPPIRGTTLFLTRVILSFSDALLVVVIVEFIEGLREQVSDLRYTGRPLSPQLIRHLLIIGIVASIRHILAIGTQLTLTAPYTPVGTVNARLFVQLQAANLAVRRSLMLEFGVSAVVVLILVTGWSLLARVGRQSDDLRKLAQLHREGLLANEEFEKAKQSLF